MKRTAEKVASQSTRVLRDQLYSVKINNVKPDESLIDDITTTLDIENDEQITKLF